MIRPHTSIYRFAALAKVKDGRDAVLEQLVGQGLASSEPIDSEFLKYEDEEASQNESI